MLLGPLFFSVKIVVLSFFREQAISFMCRIAKDRVSLEILRACREVQGKVNQKEVMQIAVCLAVRFLCSPGGLGHLLAVAKSQEDFVSHWCCPQWSCL